MWKRLDGRDSNAVLIVAPEQGGLYAAYLENIYTMNLYWFKAASTLLV